MKLTTLLALSTRMRMSELADKDKNLISFTKDWASFTLSRPRKTEFNGPLQSFSLSTFPTRSIYPVACLGIYFVFSEYLGTEHNNDSLFVGLIYPNKPVSANNIGRWVKTNLNKAGIDTSVFSAHSTRGTAASGAARSGIPTESILKQGDRARAATFARYYNKNLIADPG